jgi:hypothetical protein
MMKKIDTGTYTNHAGEVTSGSTTISTINGRSQTNETSEVSRKDEVCRWASFVLVDGEIAWCYNVRFKSDGSVGYVFDSRTDAKEYDPKLQPLIKQVDAEVTAEMKKNGSYGHLGSVHTFWERKKEKLKAKGVEWRSPGELSPNTIFD